MFCWSCILNSILCAHRITCSVKAGESGLLKSIRNNFCGNIKACDQHMFCVHTPHTRTQCMATVSPGEDRKAENLKKQRNAQGECALGCLCGRKKGIDSFFQSLKWQKSRSRKPSKAQNWRRYFSKFLLKINSFFMTGFVDFVWVWGWFVFFSVSLLVISLIKTWLS